MTFPARARTLAPSRPDAGAAERFADSRAVLLHAGLGTDVAGGAPDMLGCEWCGCLLRVVHAHSAQTPKVVISRLIPACGPCDASGPVFDDAGCTCHLLPDVMSAGGGSLLWRLEAFDHIPGDEPYALDPEGVVPVCRCGRPPDLLWLAGVEPDTSGHTPPKPGVVWACASCTGVPRPADLDGFAAAREAASVAIGMGLEPGWRAAGQGRH